MFWFLRGIRKGIVTTRYPRAVAEAWAEQLPSPPAFRGDLLTLELAGRLADSCLTGALRLDGSDLLLDVGSCTGCGACLVAGGEAAAVATGEWELASRDRAALVKRIPIGGRQ